MLGKYNLITSAGAGVQQSPSWCFALFLHQVQTQEPTSETLPCHRSLAAPAEAASSVPVPRRCRTPLAEQALILPMGRPGAALGRNYSEDGVFACTAGVRAFPFCFVLNNAWEVNVREEAEG